MTNDYISQTSKGFWQSHISDCYIYESQESHELLGAPIWSAYVLKHKI